MRERARIVAFGLALASCSHKPSTTPLLDSSAPPEAATPIAAADAAPPRELAGPSQVVFPAGVVAVPVGARSPRPMMIALHGGSDHPEWACNAWSGITNGYPFIVCPRGVGAESALAWSSPADTKVRIEKAIAATKAQYEEWIRPTDTLVLVGFSMGATQAAFAAQSDPKRYRRVVLAEFGLCA